MNGIILLVGILLLVMLITLLVTMQWGSLLLFFLAPVSYTHLDVYKRQVYVRFIDIEASYGEQE